MKANTLFRRHRSLCGRNILSAAILVLAIHLVAPLAGAQSTGGRIRGTVTDPSGGAVAGAKVTAINEATNVARDTQTGPNGDYIFLEVPVGTYTVEVNSQGFKKFVRKGIVLNLNEVVSVDLTLQVGGGTDVVVVTGAPPVVDTTSTQLGAVVNDRSARELPLNARDVYQLLQLQPGVQSQLGNDLFYGSDKAGVVTVNGGRGRSNNYSVNGGEANDQFANLPAVQPSPDSIEEFRVLTNTFDAEYGRNSGAVVNVVTKSGNNDWHGSVYEFFRNKVLNARGFLDTQLPDSKQNQYGGTFGGPIKKDKSFFFASYEGRRAIKGVSSQQITLPSPQEVSGKFSMGGTAAPFGGTMSNTIATILNNRNGCGAAIAAEAGTTPAAGNSWSSAFPNNVIPPACFDPVAVNLYQQFVPQAGNLPNNIWQGVPNSKNDEDQFSLKWDHHVSSTQSLSVYYYFEHDHNLDPFARFQAAGANIGNFGGVTDQAIQQLNVSHTWTIGTSAVNEARFTFFREGQGEFNHPVRTNLVADSCTGAAKPFCFTGQTDAPLVDASGNCLSSGAPPAGVPPNQTCPPNPASFGIAPGLGASREGVPNVVVNGGFSIGNNFEGELPQTGNTFQWSDNYSKVIGKHSLKFGGDVRYQKFDQQLFFDIPGQPVFGNSGIGNSIRSADAYPNYFLGLVNSYLQGSSQFELVRSKSVYLFAQDSWKIKPNLTLNYGLRWEMNTPLSDIGKKVETFRPGQVSTVYPCMLPAGSPLGPDCNTAGVTPVGYVFPGDKGIPDGLTQTYYKSFGPRTGLAWSPGWKDSWLAKVTGGPSKTSIRMGYGIFYNPVEQLVLEQFSAEPPFGISPFFASVFLQTPYVAQAGFANPNAGGGIHNPPRGVPLDFSVFRPILMFGDAQPNIRSQYSEQYNLTIQRELRGNVLFQIGYVGSQGHRLLASYDLNHGNPQTCLDLANLANGIPGSVVSFPVSTPPTPTACAQLSSDLGYFIPRGTFIDPAILPNGLHLPYVQGNSPQVIPAGTTIGPNGITLVGLRPYSSPLCDPYTGNRCPNDGVPVFSNIFAQNTIANSNYNSLQVLVEKRFTHGLQLQGAYTYSKSIDNASSFENTLNPVNFRATRGLSLFDARHRFVFSYYWELPVPKMEGFSGKLLNGWGTSGIITEQAGFPIRITTGNSVESIDNELFSSSDFEPAGEPNILGPFHTQNPHNSACALGTGPTAGPNNPNFPGPPPPCQPVPNAVFDPNLFTSVANVPGGIQIPGAVALGSLGDAPRTVCCGPGINNVDISVLKNTSLSERVKTEFRAEFFNAFNHAQFIGVQGDISQGIQFGRVLRARDPRLIQFALKFSF